MAEKKCDICDKPAKWKLICARPQIEEYTDKTILVCDECKQLYYYNCRAEPIK